MIETPFGRARKSSQAGLNARRSEGSTPRPGDPSLSAIGSNGVASVTEGTEWDREELVLIARSLFVVDIDRRLQLAGSGAVLTRGLASELVGAEPSPPSREVQPTQGSVRALLVSAP
jgi:hypothetical protein